MRDLEGAQDAEAEERVGRQAGDVLALEEDLAAVGDDIAGDEIEEGGFAGAVRADQSRDRAPLHRQRTMPDRNEATKAFADVLDVDHNIGCHPSPASRSGS